MQDPPPRSGILVVRAWIESGAVRARITEVADVRRAEHTISTTSTAVELESCLHAWIERLERRAGDGTVTRG